MNNKENIPSVICKSLNNSKVNKNNTTRISFNIEIVDLRFLNKKIYVKTKQNEKIVMKKEGK